MRRRAVPANDDKIHADTVRRALHPSDISDEITAKLAEERIAAQIEPESARQGVRAMLRVLRRRLVR